MKGATNVYIYIYIERERERERENRYLYIKYIHVCIDAKNQLNANTNSKCVINHCIPFLLPLGDEYLRRI
jgi:hypothetical protein